MNQRFVPRFLMFAPQVVCERLILRVAPHPLAPMQGTRHVIGGTNHLRMSEKNPGLGGGFKYFVCSPPKSSGKMIQFDEQAYFSDGLVQPPICDDYLPINSHKFWLKGRARKINCHQ